MDHACMLHVPSIWCLGLPAGLEVVSHCAESLLGALGTLDAVWFGSTVRDGLQRRLVAL